MTMNPPQSIAVACSVLLSLAVAGCSGSKAASSPTAEMPEVSVVTVHKTAVQMPMELPGRTVPVTVAQVRGRVDGIVLARRFREGADVNANQQLFQIDPAPYRAALAGAEATLERAQAAAAAANVLAERYKTLLAGNGVARQDYDNAIAAQGQ